MVLSPTAGLILLAVFGVLMLLLTLVVSRAAIWGHTRSGFLYAGRNVGGLVAGFSIAASWIWAPALFVSVQKSYELGLAGLFWFTAPNVLAVLIFALMGPAIRKRVPGGFSIPDWIRHRFQDENALLVNIAHKLYLIPFFWYQVMAVTVQIFVGGLILNYLTSIQLELAMGILLLIVIIYAVISGLRASIITDFVHLSAILIGLILVIPWFINTVGPAQIAAGFAGTSGSTNVLDPGIAFSFGIVTSIGLLAGSIADQQFWQRVFSIRRASIVRAFIIGGVLFGIVPVALSVLGFAAAAPGSPVIPPPGTELPMIGIASILHYLPLWVAVVFVVMLLSALTSVVDSGFAAAASLYAIDVRNSGNASKAELAKDRQSDSIESIETPESRKRQDRIVRDGRIAMVVLALVSYGVALLVKDIFPLDRLWWLFNGVATMFVVPTILSIFWSRLRVGGVIAGIVGALIFMVGFIYGNYVQNNEIVVYSALGMVAINLLCCVIFSLGRKGPVTA